MTPAPSCSKCGAHKAPLVHHCHICGVCVLAMDHHCPFTSNCVGLYNFFHFFLFIGYGTVGLLYACLMSYSPFALCWLHRMDGSSSHCPLEGSASLIFLPAVVLFGSACALFLFHSLLLLTNMTTVDCLVTLRRSSVRELWATMRTGYRAPDSKYHTLLMVGRPWWHFLVPATYPRAVQDSYQHNRLASEPRPVKAKLS